MAEVGKVGAVDVSEVLQRVVANDIAPARFRIILPGLARVLHLERDVIHRQGQAGRRLTVVIGDDLSGGQHKVVANRRVRVGVIVGGQAVFGDERIEVGHTGTAYHLGIAVVLQGNDNDVSELGECLCPSLHYTNEQA